MGGHTEGEIWKELERESKEGKKKKRKKRAELSGSSRGCSKAQQLPLLSPTEGLAPLSLSFSHPSPSSLVFNPALSSPASLPVSVSKKLVYNATACEDQQLVPN